MGYFIITQDDLNSAQRGLNMVAMSVAELEDMMRDFPADADMFASRVLHRAAKQMRAVKLAMGAGRDA